MPLVPTKQVEDGATYTNFTGGSTLKSSLEGIDAALAGGGGSPWVETSGKVRLVTTTNEVEMPNGTVLLPSMAYTSEPSSGLYRAAAGEPAVATLGLRHTVFNGNDGTLEIGSTGQLILDPVSTTVMNIAASSTGAQTLVVGRHGTASLTPTTNARVQGGGTTISGDTDAPAGQLTVATGNATGSGAGADLLIHTYAGGGLAGTTVRATTLHTRFDKIGHIELGPTAQNSWNAESSSNINMFGSSSSAITFSIGKIGSASIIPNTAIIVRPGGMNDTSRTNQAHGSIAVSASGGTGSGAGADVTVLVGLGGGASGTALRSPTLHTTFNKNGDIQLGALGSQHTWRKFGTSVIQMFPFTTGTAAIRFAVGHDATSGKNTNITIGPSGVLASGDATDSDAVDANYAIGPGSGASILANINLLTYGGGGASGTTLRAPEHHTRFNGNGDIQLGPLASQHTWRRVSGSIMQWFSFNTASVATRYVLGHDATFAGAKNTNITLSASGALLNGDATDSDGVAFRLAGGAPSGAGIKSAVDIYTHDGTGATGTTVQADQFHTHFDGNGTMEVKSAGTAAIPAIRVGSSLDTGMYEPSADALAWSTSGVLAFDIDASQKATFASDVSIPNSVLSIGVAAGTFTSLSGGIIELAAVTTPPTVSPGITNGGIFVDGQDLKYIKPNDTIVNLVSPWSRSGTTISMVTASDFVHLNGVDAVIGVGVGTAPTGGSGDNNAIVLNNKGANYTTGVADALSFFVNGTKFNSIDPSDVIRTYLTNLEGCVCETGSYSGNATDPQTISLTNSALLPSLVIIYGDPGAASPVDAASGTMVIKFGSSLSLKLEDLAGVTTVVFHTAGISAVATGSFDVGGRANLASTGYHYYVVGTI